MKLLRMCIALFFLTAPLFSQIPNAGFENWTNNIPDAWGTPNDPPDIVPVTPTTDAHSGSRALKATVVPLGFGALAPAAIQSGPEGEGFPCSQRYGALTGYVKFHTVGGDKLVVSVGMQKNGNAVGVGYYELKSETSTYTKFTNNISYQQSDNPDTCIISIMIIGPGNGTDFHEGSYFILDDLAFASGATGVGSDETKSVFSLAISPNPSSSDAVTIRYTAPESHDSWTSLRVFDALGNSIATLVNQNQSAGEYSEHFNTEALPNGVYWCEIRRGTWRETQKIYVLR